MTAALDRLTAALGAAHVLTSPDDVAHASLDGRGRRQGTCLAVLRPGSTEEVARVMRIAREENLVVIAQGGNTSNVEGATPSPGWPDDLNRRTVVLQTARMNRILAIDPVNNTAHVEAGVVLAKLAEAAKEADRLFPLSFAAEGSAQMGGVLATNAGGVHVLRYGNTRALTLGLKVVLADGRVLDLTRSLRKDNAGYDLKQLFIGSEGTLGIITEAVVKLEPRPQSRTVLWLTLADLKAVEGLFTALEREAGPTLTAFELIGRSPLVSAITVRGFTPPTDPADWQVLAEISHMRADDADAANERLTDMLGELMDAGLITDGAVSQSEDQADALWAIREGIPGAVKRQGGNVKHDVSVPRSRMVEVIERTTAALRAAVPMSEPSIFGHYGDGNLHFNVGAVAGSLTKAIFAFEDEIHRIVHDHVLAAGGSIAAEHGVGAMKTLELERTKDPVELDLMRTVKRALDPEGRLNPGRVVRTEGF
ncbi:MAG: FAD-binding oxidoreductase [Sutterella sp.]|nr:FAD-binding oxidoreductase [Sutterella sp.]